LRTADAATPFLTSPEAATTLVIFASVYTLIFSFGAIYIYRLLRRGPVQQPLTYAATNPKRPLSLAGNAPGVRRTVPVLEIDP
jgi:cytochrome d ubiquinol oxidase subunit I